MDAFKKSKVHDLGKSHARATAIVRFLTNTVLLAIMLSIAALLWNNMLAPVFNATILTVPQLFLLRLAGRLVFSDTPHGD